MWKATSNDSASIQVPKAEMGYCSSGEAQGWESPLALGILDEFSGKVYPRPSLGLYCWETWGLPSDEGPLQGSQVRDEGERLHVLPNRRPKLVEGPQDEDQCILSACRQIDAGRKDSRAVRRSLSRYGSKQPPEAPKVRQVPCKEEEEASKEGERAMGSSGHSPSRTGFSSTGSVAEWKPDWDGQGLQEETTLAMGPFEQWEDYFSNESTPLLPSIYGSPRLSDSRRL